MKVRTTKENKELQRLTKKIWSIAGMDGFYGFEFAKETGRKFYFDNDEEGYHEYREDMYRASLLTLS